MNLKRGDARILIVDDDEDDFLITSEYIRDIPGQKYQIEWCKNYSDGLQFLLDKRCDLCFVDYRLGAKSGVDFLKEAVRNHSEEPIILLTGKGNYDVDIQAMQYGAFDYLVKTELSVEKLERCIRYAMERADSVKALKASERKYRSIFEKSKDVVFVTDTQLNFREVNNAIENLLGYTNDEILGFNLYDLIEQPQQKAYLLEAMQGKMDVNDWEVTLLTKGGEKKFCILSLTLDTVDGNEDLLQGIVHDITNLKKVEKASLLAEKLAAAGRLVRTIAHEVRNPLNNITLSIEQMQQDIQDEESKLFMHIIEKNSKRINDLISELLNTSRPSENVLEKRPLRTIIDDAIFATYDRLTLRKIKLQLNYPEAELEIMADVNNLKLALLNIIINAIEAMQEQSGQLSVSLQQNGNDAVLVIADNGCGISEENISRLFEPYFTQKRNGIGLGLAFTLNILQAHKASIEVSSELGKGTTFTIAFPLATVSVTDQ